MQTFSNDRIQQFLNTDIWIMYSAGQFLSIPSCWKSAKKMIYLDKMSPVKQPNSVARKMILLIEIYDEVKYKANKMNKKNSKMI